MACACNPSTLEQGAMQHYYYEINPPQHAEKAYQPNQGDRFPPLSTVPTTAGGSGYIILLVTTLRNQPTFRAAEAQLIDYDALLQYNGGSFPTPEVAQKIIANYPQVVISQCGRMTPFGASLYHLPHKRVTVRPLTGGTMAKALSLESFSAAGGRL